MDSAISCSIHSLNPSTFEPVSRNPVIEKNLSAKAAETCVTTEPGSVKARDASKASSKRIETSIPISAAGVSPYALSALKRPPTFGSAFTTLNLLSLA